MSAKIVALTALLFCLTGSPCADKIQVIRPTQNAAFAEPFFSTSAPAFRSQPVAYWGRQLTLLIPLTVMTTVQRRSENLFVSRDRDLFIGINAGHIYLIFRDFRMDFGSLFVECDTTLSRRFRFSPGALIRLIGMPESSAVALYRALESFTPNQPLTCASGLLSFLTQHAGLIFGNYSALSGKGLLLSILDYGVLDPRGYEIPVEYYLLHPADRLVDHVDTNPLAKNLRSILLRRIGIQP